MFNLSFYLFNVEVYGNANLYNKYTYFNLVDYIKILLVKIDVKRLLGLLEFKTEVSTNTGLISSKKVAEYHFCKITVYDNGVILFTGSIHKLWNSLNNINAPNYNEAKKYKGFNGNQFTIENILEVKNYLELLFDCEPQQMVFQNIELGVNTTPGFDPNLYLKGLLYHKNKIFEYRYNSNLAQAQHQRFIFKIYNKSHQYAMSFNVLRIELKINKTAELKPIGLKTFLDINTKTLQRAKEMLLNRFDEIMHYDYTIKKKTLTGKQNQLLKSYSNPRYWINDLKPQHRHRHKKRLEQITQNYSENLHQQLRQDLIQKCVIINRRPKKSKCVIINSSSIGLNVTQLEPVKTLKKCLVTGVNISMQKDNSNLLSNTGLKHIESNNPKLFKKLINIFLTGEVNKFEKSIYDKLSKQIRNKYYNNLSNFNLEQIKLF